MRAHLEFQAERNRVSGMSAEEAQAAAEREFGNVGVIQQQVRERRDLLGLEGWGRDLRLAVRALGHQRGFAAVVIATLALGIGANSAVFTLVNAVLLRPLAVTDEGRVMVAWIEGAPDGETGGSVSYLDFADWRARSSSFSALGIFERTEVLVQRGNVPLRATAAVISPEVLAIAGHEPAKGRYFVAADELAGAATGASPAILTYRAWIDWFGGDPGAIGSILQVDEKPCEIVGVLPLGLFSVENDPVELLLTPAYNGDPARPGSANASRSYRPYDGVLARLRPGVSQQVAADELEALNTAIKKAHPELNQAHRTRVMPLRAYLVGDYRQRLWLLLGVVALVLLAACVNVANLLLSRAAGRQREFAIRAALGAGPGLLARQRLAEILPLAAVGGGGGLLLAVWLTDLASAFLPAGVPHLSGLGPDWRVLAFTAFAALGTGMVCALIPVFFGRRGRPAEDLKADGRTSTGDDRSHRARGFLTVTQIGITFALLIGAGLLLRSLTRLEAVRPGFCSSHVLTGQIALSGARYQGRNFDPRPINAFLDQLAATLAALPGVSQVAFAQCVPLTNGENNTSFQVIEHPHPPGSTPAAQLRFVSDSYFDLLQIPVRAGRGFGRGDTAQSAPVAVVNEAFVRRELGGENPLGRHLALGWGGDQAKEIVGVVGDVRHRGLDDEARPEVYVPQSQFGNASITILLRTDREPEAMGDTLRQAVARLDPGVPVTKIATLENYRQRSLSGARFGAGVLAGFAILVLVLTVVGVYGTMSYEVACRQNEIGLRMALGADAGTVRRLVLSRGLRLAATGVATGLVLALAGAALVRGQLYGTSVVDPLVYIGTAGFVLAIASLATWWPAQRAVRVDPKVALRAE